MMQDSRKTAGILAIGDELLSGRTRDMNIHFLAGWLADRGIRTGEARIVGDDKQAIASALNAMRAGFDYVFTSGGIGPTHDDITASAIAEAFGVSCPINEDAKTLLQSWYEVRGEALTEGRLRMAHIPEGASLIKNTVSGAPGFQIENVFVLAGVPAIMQAMLDDVDHRLDHGPVDYVVTILGQGLESQLSAGLVAIEQALYGVKIGSYPGKTGKGYNLSIVVKSLDKDLSEQAAEAVAALFRSLGSEPEMVRGAKRPDEAGQKG